MDYVFTKSDIEVSIIIVNYNAADYIKNSINSIKSHIEDVKYEIIVVDNNSHNRDIENLPELFPEVKFYFLNENLGFSGGNNFGVEKSNSDYLLFLNPDTILIEDCISPLLLFLSMNSDCGCCSPRLLNEDMTDQESFGNQRGITIEILDAFYILYPLYLIIRKFLFKNRIKKGKPFSVGWISGAFMIIPRYIFELVNGFSTKFKLNFEDMDLSYKIRKKGYKLLIFPLIRCIHLKSKSQRKSFYNYIYYRYKGRLIFLKNHYNNLQKVIIILIQIFGLLIRLLFTGLIFRGYERKERYRAFIDSLKLYIRF